MIRNYDDGSRWRSKRISSDEPERFSFSPLTQPSRAFVGSSGMFVSSFLTIAVCCSSVITTKPFRVENRYKYIRRRFPFNSWTCSTVCWVPWVIKCKVNWKKQRWLCKHFPGNSYTFSHTGFNFFRVKYFIWKIFFVPLSEFFLHEDWGKLNSSNSRYVDILLLKIFFCCFSRIIWWCKVMSGSKFY